MYQYINNGTVTSVKGFKAAGIYCGIKKRKKDIALIYSEQDCVAAGTYTINKVKAAPLLISQSITSQNKTVKAVLVNSGNANACTGDEGYNDAVLSQKVCAEKLGIAPDEVLLASTGVIGQRLPMEALLKGIDDIVPQLTCEGGLDAAEAIMTTDKKMKSFAVKVELKDTFITIGGICKGSGMIMPNMATMLGFIATDISIDKSLLQESLSEAVNKTFNKITVDGETSTNDMVVILANGISGIKIEEGTEELKFFKEALEALCRDMAKSIVADGEGATKLVTVTVKNARTKSDAELVGKSIANSPLVKTAIHGADANWGRILSAAGQSGADIDPSKVSISFNDLPVLLPNYKLALDEKAASKILSQAEFSINIDLGQGKENTTWWTCDFSEEYVSINADYRS
ncbi:MAG: bifunctional glutamate N-acetyltransferase/amino-acid acetyltransferase ArgJ [Ignavibacteriaceae bacterium]